MSDHRWNEYPEVFSLEPGDKFMVSRESAPPGEKQRVVSAETVTAELGGGGGPGPGPGGPGIYDVNLGFVGQPIPEQRDMVLIGRYVTFYEDDVLVWCAVPPDAPVVFIVRWNFSQAGTITIDTGGNATVEFSTTPDPITFSPGQRLVLEAPSPADPSLEGIYVAFVGQTLEIES